LIPYVPQGVKDQFGDAVSWADLIVLAGTMGVEAAGGAMVESLPFCPGRTDAADGAGLKELQPLLTGQEKDANWVKLRFNQMGLTLREAVALFGGLATASELIVHTVFVEVVDPAAASNAALLPLTKLLGTRGFLLCVPKYLLLFTLQ